MDHYSGSVEHIAAELERLDLLLRLQVWQARQRHAGGDDGELPAFYIAENEVDELLNKTLGAPTWNRIPLPPQLQQSAQARLDQLAEGIAQRTTASLEQGIDLRLVALSWPFKLNAFDVDVVLISLAPEIDRRYERLYAYLHDDVTRRLPTVELALDLLCPDLQSKMTLRSRFNPAAPLIKHGLLQWSDEPGQTAPPLLGKKLQLDPRIVRFLLDDDQPDEQINAYIRLIEPTIDAQDLVFAPPFRQQLEHLAQTAHSPDRHWLFYFQGPYGVGKQSAAEVFCANRGLTMLVIDGQRLAELKPEHFERLVQRIEREARLQGAALYWQGFDKLLANDKAAYREIALKTLELHPNPGFLAGDEVWEPADSLQDTVFIRLPFPQPGYEERVELWRKTLPALGPDSVVKDVDLPGLANKFRLSGGQIRDAAATAANLARARDPATPLVTADDLNRACRLQSNRKLVALAQKIEPHYSWQDIVLTDDQMAHLREIHQQIRYQALVYDSWGFGRKLAMGKGLNVLFTGPPGTGKTMAADVLANTLDLDLYKIDLSNIVSKYIGETEKNLANIFAEAGTSNAILFFDEADALFGKRTQVKDAHDRYANVEISYLLQKMEEYEGVVILATNLRKNMDDAFIRRLHFTIEFNLPDVEERHRIWQQIWPQATPRAEELDLEFMAKRIEVAGGNIRNIALASAFLAAADGGKVTMQHLIRATRREYQKMGKVLTACEFGDYSD